MSIITKMVTHQGGTVTLEAHRHKSPVLRRGTRCCMRGYHKQGRAMINVGGSHHFITASSPAEAYYLDQQSEVAA